MSWLSGYLHRVKIPINASADGALTNFQVSIAVIKATGTNSAGTIYLQNEGLNWPYDIRFTSSDGSTLIDFWRKEYDSTDGTWIIEVPTIAGTGTTDIYLYYGKSGDSDGSNIYNTCIAPSDDFRYPAWTTLADLPWTPADETCAVVNGKLYVIGGYVPGATSGQHGYGGMNDCWEYDISTTTWTQKTGMPTDRWGMIAVAVGSLIYVFGGESHGTASTKLEIYNPSTDSWTTGNSCPAAIGAQGISGCTDGTDIYLQYGVYVYKYTVADGTYTQLSSAVPSGPTWAVTVYSSGKLYVIGGYYSGAASSLNRIYTIASNTWSSGYAQPYALYGSVRENVLLNGNIYIVSGQSTQNQFFATVLAYNISGNSWTEYSPGPYAADGNAGSFVDGIMYAIGGRNTAPSTEPLAYFAKYNPSGDSSQSRWTWAGVGQRACPDDKLYLRTLTASGLARVYTKSNIDTDNKIIEVAVKPIAVGSGGQTVSIYYSDYVFATTYVWINRADSNGKLYLGTRQSGAWSSTRWISTNVLDLGTEYHLKIVDLGTSIKVTVLDSSDVEIENSGFINYDTVTTLIHLASATVGDKVEYKNLSFRKYTANEPTWASPDYKETVLPLDSATYSEVGSDIGMFLSAIRAAIGEYTGSGSSVGLLYSRIFNVDNTTINYSGSSTGLLRSYPMAANSGSISSIGGNISLLRSLSLTTNVGNIGYIGSGSSLLRSLLLNSNSNTYNITEGILSLVLTRAIIASGSNITLTGNSVSLLKNLILHQDPGVFNISGYTTSLLSNKLLSSYGQSYLQYSNDVSLLRSYVIPSTEGNNYSISGNLIDVLRSLSLNCENNYLLLTGNSSSLLKSYLILPSSGSYYQSGNNLSLLTNRLLSCEDNIFSISGKSSEILYYRLLNSVNESYEIVGTDNNLFRYLTLHNDNDNYIIFGYPSYIMRIFDVDSVRLSIDGTEVEFKFYHKEIYKLVSKIDKTIKLYSYQ